MVRVTCAFGEVCWWGCSEGHEKGGSECEKQIKGYKEGESGGGEDGSASLNTN